MPSRLALRFLLAPLLAITALLWPALALASGAKSVAIFIEGGDADAVAAEVQSVLPSGVTAVDDKAFAEALRKAGQGGGFGNALAVKGALRDKMLARAKKAMETAGADAAILGRVRLGKLGKEVWLVWLGADGDVRADAAAALRGDADERRKELHAVLDAPATALVPASESSGGGGSAGGSSGSDDPGDHAQPHDSSGKDTASGDAKPKSARAAHLVSTSLFDVGVAFEMGGRHVAFTDAISQNIRPYDVLGAPMIAASAAVYPAATTGIPVLKDIGLAARVAFAVGLSSSTKGGKESIANTWIRFRGGLRWRLVPGTERGPVFGLTGDFGIDTFSFDNAGDLAGSVPAADYKYLRAGAEMRLPLGPIAFELGGGYRGLLSVGPIGDRFTKGSAIAFDGFVGFAVPLPAGLEARLSGDYTRVAYAFSPAVGDAYVAGGAVDEMLGARLGLAYVY